jgi:hypothetical protein
MRFVPTAELLAAIALAIAIATPTATAAADEPAQKPLAFRAEAKVTLDAAGKPLAIEASQDLPPPIRSFIEQRVATRHYSPPERDGVTGPAVTYLTLGACALPTPEGSDRLAVDFKRNGPRYANGPMFLGPAYPNDANRKGIGASMVVTYVVGTDGRAALEKLEYTDGRKHRRDGFDEAIRVWLRDMRFEPEQLAGKPVRTRIQTKVVFNAGPHVPSTDEIRRELEANAARSDECRLAAGDTKPGGMVPMALNSPVRVESAG